MPDVTPFVDPREGIDSEAVRGELRALLPNAYTMLEYDLLAVSRRESQVEAPLEALVDPLQTPEGVLPFLAWEYSTNLWSEQWPLGRKRKIVADSHRLHSLKGTVAGLRAHLEYTDTPMLKVVAPPQKAFAGRSYTKAEKQAWLAPMPRLRLYPFMSEGIGTGKSFPRTRAPKLFCGRSNATKGGFTYRAFMPLTTAGDRVGVRAFLYDPLDKSLVAMRSSHVVKSEVTGLGVDQYQVFRKGNGGLAFFPGKGRVPAKPHYILGGHQLSAGLYTVNVDKNYSYEKSALATNTITTSLTPIDASYMQVYEHGTATPAQCFPKHRAHNPTNNMVLRKRFLPRTRAGYRIYQEMVLLDPTRAGAVHKARTFLNHQRLGMPAFTAEVSVIVKNRKPRLAVNGFVRGFLYKTPSDKLDFALRALRVAKSDRDKILMKVGNYKVPSLDRGFPLDTGYRFGDRLLTY